MARTPRISATCRKGTVIDTSEPAPLDAAPLPESPPTSEVVDDPSTRTDDLEPPGPSTPPKKRRRIGWIIAVALLGAAVIAAGVYIYHLVTLLEAATMQIRHQEEIIEQKEIFGAAMDELVETTAEFDGLLFADIVPVARIETLAGRGWVHRWDADALARDTVSAGGITTELAEVLSTARERAAAGNVSATAYESTIDTLGNGFVDSLIRADADTFCGGDVLGCVDSIDPYVVHFDANEIGQPYLTDWVQTGIAYHEFAHVLQDTNPEATATAVEVFGGDPETMADCFALTYLSGWTLDHRIWVSSYEYWDLSVGYGYVCDETQRQAIRDWYAALGFHAAPVAQ